MEISFEDLISKEDLEQQEKRVQEMRDRIIKKQVEEGDFNPLIFSEKRPLLAAVASPRNSAGRNVIKKNALGMNVVVDVPYEQTGMFETSKLNKSLAKSIYGAPLLNSSSMKSAACCSSSVPTGRAPISRANLLTQSSIFVISIPLHLFYK